MDYRSGDRKPGLKALEFGAFAACAAAGRTYLSHAVALQRARHPALSERSDEVRAWIRNLENGSKPQRGFGYEIQWRQVNHRRLGPNRVPCGAAVPGESDALQLIGMTAQAERCALAAGQTLQAFPVLRVWLALRPLTLLEHLDDWLRVVAVLQWFSAHPNSGLYLRQADIPGVDTKFIESRQGLLTELLDRIVTPSPARNFEQRYGLLPKPAMLRFRILDSRFAIAGLTDLTVPLPEFASLNLSVKSVFITENETNGLAFPDVPESIVIFGLGYGVQMLREIPWLHEKHLWYWGDIDTHGFAILDRLRAAFPQTRSLLMDRQTLLAHRELWGSEPETFDGVVTRLNEAELTLFEDLREDRIGYAFRLEQELISFGWFQRRLSECSV